MTQELHPFDLEERTAIFGESVIDLVKTLSKSALIQSIIIQLLRSATSVGANYMEANGAESKKDFYHKIGIVIKEIKETKHWLRMLARIDDTHSETIRSLWTEAQELTLIFSSIRKKNSA